MRLLLIHPDINDHIAAIYIQIMHKIHFNNMVLYWLIRLDKINLNVGSYDPKIFARFEFYNLLEILCVHRNHCNKKLATISIMNAHQKFAVRIACCNCKAANHREYFFNRFDLNYSQIYQLFLIMCENKVIIHG